MKNERRTADVMFVRACLPFAAAKARSENISRPAFICTGMYMIELQLSVKRPAANADQRFPAIGNENNEFQGGLRKKFNVIK